MAFSAARSIVLFILLSSEALGQQGSLEDFSVSNEGLCSNDNSHGLSMLQTKQHPIQGSHSKLKKGRRPLQTKQHPIRGSPSKLKEVPLLHRIRRKLKEIRRTFQKKQHPIQGAPSKLMKKGKAWNGTRIVGVSWKKSGTSSIQAACEQFGMMPYNVPPDYWTPDEGSDLVCRDAGCMKSLACVADAPTCCDHDLIAAMKRETSSEVKFVLTERSPQSWRQSVDAWMSKKPKYACWYGELMKARYGTKEFYEGYAKHNEFVKQLFSDEPERLLVLNLEEDDPVKNMRKFCKFVGIEDAKCHVPFPQSNHNVDNQVYPLDSLVDALRSPSVSKASFSKAGYAALHPRKYKCGNSTLSRFPPLK